MNPRLLHSLETPAFYKTGEELHDGAHSFAVEHTMTPAAWAAAYNGHPEDIESVVLANGTFTGRVAFGPFVEGIVRQAGRDQKALSLTTYDDPHVGDTAYAQSYRTERLMRVVAHTTESRQHNGEQGLALIGQSRGWISAVQAAEALRDEQHITSLTGVAPIGHLPFDITVCAQDVLHIGRLTAQEALSVFGLSVDPYRWRAVLGIGMNALRHSGLVDPKPLYDIIRGRKMPLFHEVQELLTSDVTDTVVGLSQNLGGALTMIGLKRDMFVPGERLQQKFDGLTGFAGRLMLVDGTHADSLTDKRRVLPAVYEALTTKS